MRSKGTVSNLSTNDQKKKGQENKTEIFDYDKYLASKKPAPKKSVKSSKAEKKAGKQTAKNTKPIVKEAEEPVKEEPISPEEIVEKVLESTAVNTAEEVAPAIEEAPEKPSAEEITAEAVAEGIPAEASVEQPTTSKNSRRRKKKKKEAKQDLDETMDSIKQAIDEALDEALDEDISEIEEISVQEEVKTPPRKTSFRRSMYFAVGVTVSVMAVIGFIFSVNFVAGVVKNVADNTAQKNEFAKFVYPLVIIDPAPFDSASQLSSETVLTAAIWDIILYGDKEKYPQEYGVMTVPEIDVELHATNLLGTGLVFDHKNLGTAELTFYYDAENKSYNVPVSPSYFPYSPYVETIQRSGDNYSLKVGYVSPHPEWLGTDENEKPQPDKYMEYVVHKNRNDCTLVAIKEIEGSYIPNPY